MVSPNFDNQFIVYSFYFEDSVATMLTEKNQKGEELPISFMIKELHDYEIRYSPSEKQVFSLLRAVSKFIPYILSSPVKDYVPHLSMKMMLS